MSCYSFNSYFWKLPRKCFLLDCPPATTNLTWFLCCHVFIIHKFFSYLCEWAFFQLMDLSILYYFPFQRCNFMCQIVRDAKSLTTANENYLWQPKLRETLWTNRMRKRGRPHGVGRKIQELRLLFLFFPVVLTFFYVSAIFMSPICSSSFFCQPASTASLLVSIPSKCWAVLSSELHSADYGLNST